MSAGLQAPLGSAAAAASARVARLVVAPSLDVASLRHHLYATLSSFAPPAGHQELTMLAPKPASCCAVICEKTRSLTLWSSGRALSPATTKCEGRVVLWARQWRASHSVAMAAPAFAMSRARPEILVSGSMRSCRNSTSCNMSPGLEVLRQGLGWPPRTKWAATMSCRRSVPHLHRIGVA